MKVGELMTGTNLITARPGTPVLEARQLMLKEKIRHLLVTEDGGLLVGVVTDRDIRLNLPSQATSLSTPSRSTTATVAGMPSPSSTRSRPGGSPSGNSRARACTVTPPTSPSTAMPDRAMSGRASR
jgi:CBS domain-containing protein